MTSAMGACCTILFLLISVVFTYSKILVLQKKSDVTIMSSVQDNAFDDSFKFSADQGMFIAAALTAYDGNTEIIEEAKYGELFFEHYGWGYEGGIGLGGGPIEYHYCSDEELGLEEGPNTKIYPIFESVVTEVVTWKKKFKCIDSKDTIIWGDYNSSKA